MLSNLMSTIGMALPTKSAKSIEKQLKSSGYTTHLNDEEWIVPQKTKIPKKFKSLNDLQRAISDQGVLAEFETVNLGSIIGYRLTKDHRYSATGQNKPTAVKNLTGVLTSGTGYLFVDNKDTLSFLAYENRKTEQLMNGAGYSIKNTTVSSSKPNYPTIHIATWKTNEGYKNKELKLAGFGISLDAATDMLKSQ
jgi:hypothetical protein